MIQSSLTEEVPVNNYSSEMIVLLSIRATVLCSADRMYLWALLVISQPVVANCEFVNICDYVQ